VGHLRAAFAHLAVLVACLRHLLDVGGDHHAGHLVGALADARLARHRSHLGQHLADAVAPSLVAPLHGVFQLGGQLVLDADFLVVWHRALRTSLNDSGSSEMIAVTPMANNSRARRGSSTVQAITRTPAAEASSSSDPSIRV